MKIDTESYKGVRDFYPEDLFVQNYIFNTMRHVVELYGYNEYGASILEPSELYSAKSSEEIVSEQTYSFKDRGDRSVTLRPEMTPTVARMIAGRKRELSFPVRWYSIPNLFRYEKPQRGRLREHWQLNVDLFGVSDVRGDIEIITIADRLMKAFGAKKTDYSIIINSRKVLDFVLKQIYSLSDADAKKITQWVDKKEKVEPAVFIDGVRLVLEKNTEDFLELLTLRSPEKFRDFIREKHKSDVPGIDDVILLESELAKHDVSVLFNASLVRGFDYYTGIIFEVFDIDSKNRRSLFGGGRYDDLLSVFGSEKVPAVGFGMGDVTIRDFLEIRNLIPKFTPRAQIYICIIGKENTDAGNMLAEKLRSEGLRVAVDISNKNIGDQITTASKQKIPFVLIVGDDEKKSGDFVLKDLHSGKQLKIRSEDIAKHIS